MKITNNREAYANETAAINVKTASARSFNIHIQETQVKEEVTKTQSLEKEEKQSEFEDIEVLRALAEDIFSLMKTGLTVAEVEAVQELLKELKDKIREGNYSEKEVEELLSKAEKAIAAMQKRVTGQAIIETEGNNIKSEETKGSGSVEDKFLERIEKAMTKLENLKAGIALREDAANESEVLAMIKEFNS